MNRNEVEKKVKKIISEYLKIDIQELNNSFQLSNNSASSIDFIEIIIHLEKEFDIEFNDENLLISNLEKIDLLVDTVLEIKNAS